MLRSLVPALLFVLACGNSKGGNGVHPDAAPAPYCTPKAGTNLKLTEIASNLEDPDYLTAIPGDGRIFIVERPGRIRLIGADGILRDNPWFDIHDKVLAGGEQGLLGFTFHPDFAHTGKFYVDYTRQ